MLGRHPLSLHAVHFARAHTPYGPIRFADDGLRFLTLRAHRDPPRQRVFQCELCAFSYDKAKGLPDEGIAPGTRWEDAPQDWICPDCADAPGRLTKARYRAGAR